MNAKKIFAILSLMLLMVPFFSLFTSAAEEKPEYQLEVSGEHGKVYKLKTLNGSGELYSVSEINEFTFEVKSKENISISYTLDGMDIEGYGKFFIYTLYAEDTANGPKELTLHLKDKDGKEFDTFVVKLNYKDCNAIEKWFWSFTADFKLNFIDDNRYLWLVKGLKNTAIITCCALLIGILIGTVVAAIRSTYDKNKEVYKAKGGFFYIIIKSLNWICNLYLTVIRGTPVVLQLMIIYFIVFASSSEELPSAIFAFGINSGAYVAEIFRGGIMAIDNGQFEAGRSLGFNYVQTMIHIIIPQMFKSTLPTLCNEFISLLKETSVAGYVGILDLTKGGELIRGRTMSAFMPLIAVALIYLIIVVILTRLVSLLERRLRKNER